MPGGLIIFFLGGEVEVEFLPLVLQTDKVNYRVALLTKTKTQPYHYHGSFLFHLTTLLLFYSSFSNSNLRSLFPISGYAPTGLKMQLGEK